MKKRVWTIVAVIVIIAVIIGACVFGYVSGQNAVSYNHIDVYNRQPPKNGFMLFLL